LKRSPSADLGADDFHEALRIAAVVAEIVVCRCVPA
jgi:hypothetical protein